MAKKSNSGVSNFVKFSQMGLTMGLTIGLSVWLGVWLDGKYTEPSATQVFTIIFSLLGVFSSMYLMIKKVIKITKDDI